MLDFYQIEHPIFEQHCIYRLYRANLADLSRKHKIKFNHHDALSDALVCAELLKEFESNKGIICFLMMYN
jgi:DNA polymerase III subunit epsilon